MQENTPEFSRVLDVKAVGNAVKEHNLIAKPQERKALEKRLGVFNISLFQILYTVEQIPNKSFKISAKIKAELNRECVVTSKPVKEKINEEIHIILRPKNPGQKPENDVDLSTVSTQVEEEMEIPSNGKIDMGEVFTQYFALALNPYPRAKGAEFSQKESDHSPKSNPFDVLKDLK